MSMKRSREELAESTYRISTPVGSGSPFKSLSSSVAEDDIYSSPSPKQMQTPAPNCTGAHESTLRLPSSVFFDAVAARDKAVARDKAAARVHEWVRTTATEPEMNATQRDDRMRRVLNSCQLMPNADDIIDADVERLVWSLDAAFLGGALKALALPNVEISVSNRMSATLYSLQHEGEKQRTTFKVSRMLVGKCAAVRCASVYGVPVQDARATLAYVVAGVAAQWVSEAAGMRGGIYQQQLIARRKFGIDMSAHLTLPPSVQQAAKTCGIINGSIVAYMSSAGPIVASVCVIRKNVTVRVPDMGKNDTSEPKRIKPYTFAAHFYPTVKLSVSQLRLADEEEKALFSRMYLASQAAATP